MLEKLKTFFYERILVTTYIGKCLNFSVFKMAYFKSLKVVADTTGCIIVCCDFGGAPDIPHDVFQ